jgi:hypothetical protein
MRKAACLMAVLLLSAIWVLAQTTSTATQPSSPTGTMPQSSGTAQNPASQTPTTTPPNTQGGNNSTGATATNPNTQNTQGTAAAQTGAAPQAAPGPQKTMEGCLSGLPGQYSLITKSGQVYSLGGDDSLLGNHVGEVVRITGAETSASAAASTGSAPGVTSANGGTPYGSTGTTGSQPGATTQSQTSTAPGQANPAPPATNSAATAAPTHPEAPAAASGPRFQVSDLTKVSAGCKMVEPH